MAGLETRSWSLQSGGIPGHGRCHGDAYRAGRGRGNQGGFLTHRNAMKRSHK